MWTSSCLLCHLSISSSSFGIQKNSWIHAPLLCAGPIHNRSVNRWCQVHFSLHLPCENKKELGIYHVFVNEVYSFYKQCLRKYLVFLNWQLMSALASLEKSEEYLVFLNWRLCRHCLQNEWSLSNLFILPKAKCVWEWLPSLSCWKPSIQRFFFSADSKIPRILSEKGGNSQGLKYL